MIGRILSVHDRGTNLIMSVHDGTGELEVAHWLNEESEQVSGVPAQRRCRDTVGCEVQRSARCGVVFGQQQDGAYLPTCWLSGRL